MNQRPVFFTALAILIFAVTGAVNVPNSLAAAGRPESAPLLYAQLATGVPPQYQLEYHYISEEMLSQIDGKGGGPITG